MAIHQRYFHLPYKVVQHLPLLCLNPAISRLLIQWKHIISLHTYRNLLNRHLIGIPICLPPPLSKWMHCPAGYAPTMTRANRAPHQVNNKASLIQAAFSVPARPENVRVPSRPRGEMPTHEDSEVAANVFASMLGVVSAAPYFPEQQRDASWRSQGQSSTPPYAQQNMAQPQGNNVAGTSNAGLSSNDLLQVFGAPGVPQNQMGTPSLQGYQPQQDYGQASSGNSIGNMSTGMSQQQAIPMNSNSTGFQSPQFGDYSSRQAKPQAKSEKRGFFSKFMDWFSR